MSIQAEAHREAHPTPRPEFSELGKRIEMLRIARGLSKQHLARYAGTSRQQLWRVLSGKSDLTVALKVRLAEALGVAADDLSSSAVPSALGAPGAASALSLAEYLASPAAIARTLSSMPTGEPGRALKRRLLDDLEDVALARGLPLGARFFNLRRRVLADDI